MSDDEHRRDVTPAAEHGARRPTPDLGDLPSARGSSTSEESRDRPAPGAQGGSGSSAQAAFWPEDYTPGRADYVCMTLLALSAVYGIVIMLARPTLLAFNPLVLATLSGSRSALVTIGAQHAVGATGLVVVVAAFVLSTISVIKLDLLFWWAGRLWGDFFIVSLVGDSARKAKQAARAEALARRYATLAIVLCNVPILPIPRSLVCAVLGVSGTSFRKLLVVDLVAAGIVQALWLYLGFRIGEPVVQAVEVIARYSLWLTLAIFVVIVLGAMRKSRSRARAAGDA
ncbi:DedA family protein [Mobilicoccus massiliensis]|uniref:DedA family protein n=1 Tax=Mobilicoccus massiliensis TaxID=1522310 RepID=UPI00058CF072|nr:VTT domain-containing protein [Mobilicoccus massiliensis]